MIFLFQFSYLNRLFDLDFLFNFLICLVFFRIAHGSIPLHYFVKRAPSTYDEYKENIVSLLIRGHDVDFANYSAETLLHAAILGQNPSIVKFLVDLGADINARTAKGDTPLHYAVRQKNVQLTQMLLDEGADIEVEGRGGVTPIEIAYTMEDEEFIEFIQSK